MLWRRFFHQILFDCKDVHVRLKKNSFLLLPEPKTVPVSSRIEEISIDEFDLSLSGMRIMNMTRILQVEKSMRLHGQLQPVVARVHEGGYQLIDGFKSYVDKIIMQREIPIIAINQHIIIKQWANLFA